MAYCRYYLYPLTKSEGYSFGGVRVSVHSVPPSVHTFLSVGNHISVLNGQIWFILSTNYQYHRLSISYKFRQNRMFNTCVIALVLVNLRQLQCKTIIGFLCDDIHIYQRSFTVILLV